MATFPGEGCYLQVYDTAAWHTIINVKSIEHTGQTFEQVPNYSLQDVIKKTRASKKLEPGSVSFTGDIDPTDTHWQMIETLAGSGAEKDFQYVYTTGTAAQNGKKFKGYITSYDRTMEDEANIEGTVEIKLNTALTTGDPATAPA